MKKYISVIGTALLIVAGFTSVVSAQSKDETRIREILKQNTDSFVANDMATLDKIWANDEAVIVFENGYANYGWADYRNNHLGPEMKEIANTKYDSSDIKVRVSGKMAYATFKYTISGDANGKHFDSGGLGTAVLEKRDGKWMIVHWHSSAPRRQPAPVKTTE
jgi:ketosteroid isomerase-like protein